MLVAYDLSTMAPSATTSTSDGAEDLRMDALAEVAGMSKYHFSRLFKDAVGVPPYRYVVQQRVEAARGLLLRTDLSVTQIALRAGFSSQSHLSTAFREHASFAG